MELERSRQTPKETKKAWDDKIISVRGSYTPIFITKVKNRCRHLFPLLLFIGDPCVVQYNTGRRLPALTECAFSHGPFRFQYKLLKLVGFQRKLCMPEDISSGNQAKWARWYCRQSNPLSKRERTFRINELSNTTLCHEWEASSR